MGAFMNVRINASGYDDKDFVDDVLRKGREIEKKARIMEDSILKIVNEKIGV
jgi:glutamate formiminotransferase/formiminotetrahydrofolate cyclodeaminase